MSLKSNSTLNEFGTDTVSIFNDTTGSNGLSDLTPRNDTLIDLTDNNTSNGYGVKAVGIFRGGTGRNDRYDGTPRNDTLFGLKGNDTLKGFAGDDQLRGDEGTDFIYGGTGRDNLTGGTDPDFFYFDINDIRDNLRSNITDFTQSGPGGRDILRMKGGIGSGIFSRDQFFYNVSTSTLFFQPNPSMPATQFEVAFFSNRPNFDVVTQLEITR